MNDKRLSGGGQDGGPVTGPGGVGDVGLRPVGQPASVAEEPRFLITRLSGLCVSCLAACSLLMSAASLSRLSRTAARPRDIAAS